MAGIRVKSGENYIPLVSSIGHLIQSASSSPDFFERPPDFTEQVC